MKMILLYWLPEQQYIIWPVQWGQFPKLTVLTSSLRVALELCMMPNINIIQLGGEVREKVLHPIVGSISESVLKQFSCHKLFLGVDGIDLEFGISCSSAAEAHLNQAMIECAEKVIVWRIRLKLIKRFWQNSRSGQGRYYYYG